MTVACEATECSEIPHFIAGAADAVCYCLQAAHSTPTATQEPSPLEQQIKDVIAEISTGVTEMTDLRKTKPEGWRDELAYLREKDKQLREKENQLREKELLLLRKADT